jgi:hypothetical protein
VIYGSQGDQFTLVRAATCVSGNIWLVLVWRILSFYERSDISLSVYIGLA